MRKTKQDFAVLDGKHSGEVITVAKASKNTDALCCASRRGDQCRHSNL